MASAQEAAAMSNRTLLRLAVIGALLPLGGCYVAPGAVAPFGYAAPTGTAYANPAAGQYAGTTCAAGAYICQIPPGPLGAECSCPGLGAPSFGVIR